MLFMAEQLQNKPLFKPVNIQQKLWVVEMTGKALEFWHSIIFSNKFLFSQFSNIKSIQVWSQKSSIKCL